MVYSRKVQYYETDKMGVVHHSNYIRWFEEARTEYMSANGIDYSDIESCEGLMMPVIAVECSYKQGAKYSETVDIETEISSFNGIKIVFTYNMYNKDRALLVKGSSTHCFVDMSFKPVRIKRTHKHLYDKILNLTARQGDDNA